MCWRDLNLWLAPTDRRTDQICSVNGCSNWLFLRCGGLDTVKPTAIERWQYSAEVVDEPTKPTSFSGRHQLHWWSRGTSSLYRAEFWRVLLLVYECVDTMTSSLRDAFHRTLRQLHVRPPSIHVSRRQLCRLRWRHRLALSRLDYSNSNFNGLLCIIQNQSATNCAECCMPPIPVHAWCSTSGGLNTSQTLLIFLHALASSCCMSAYALKWWFRNSVPLMCNRHSTSLIHISFRLNVL